MTYFFVLNQIKSPSFSWCTLLHSNDYPEINQLLLHSTDYPEIKQLLLHPSD